MYQGGATKKKFIYKVFNQESLFDQSYFDVAYFDATPTQTWEDEVISSPSFRSTINGGAGELNIKLARPVDSFGEADDVKLNNHVEVWVYDNESPNGVLLYSGFISAYAPVIEGNKQYIDITLLGYIVETTWTLLEDGAGNTGLVYRSEDPSDIFTDILDKYISKGGRLRYSSDSIQASGTVVTYTFTFVTIKEALDKCLELLPRDWYYYVRPDGTVYLQGPSPNVDHVFSVGKNINSMRVTNRIEDVRNYVYFAGGTPIGDSQLFIRFARTGSSRSYGRKEERIQDGRVTLSTTASTIANRYLDYRETPTTRTELTILDNNGSDQSKGYDIESVRLGQQCRISNLQAKTTSSNWDAVNWDAFNWAWEDNLTHQELLKIVGITYSADRIVLEAAERYPEINKRIEDLERNVGNLINSQIPSNPDEEG